MNKALSIENITDAKSILKEMEEECACLFKESVLFAQRERFQKNYAELERLLKEIDLLQRLITRFTEKNSFE